MGYRIGLLYDQLVDSICEINNGLGIRVIAYGLYKGNIYIYIHRITKSFS